MHTSVEKVVHPRDIPADRAIPAFPTSLEEIYTLLLARLQPLKEVTEVAAEEQKNFANIILGELAVKWGDFRMQINDPFLSPRENQEVKRLVAVEIVKRSQSLFMNTISHAVSTLHRNEEDTNTGSQLFSMAANMSRLRAQLVWNISEAISIQRLRFELIEKVKSMRDKKNDSVKTRSNYGSGYDLKELASITLQPAKKIEIKPLIKSRGRLADSFTMMRADRQSILEKFTLDRQSFSTLVYQTSDPVSISKNELELGSKQKIQFGSLLSDVIVPKFNPEEILSTHQLDTSTAMKPVRRSETYPIPDTQFEKNTDDDDDDLNPVSKSEVNLISGGVADYNLLNYNTSIRALHLQGQLDTEVEGDSDSEGEEEEEELPPLLCGVVSRGKRPKLKFQEVEVTLSNDDQLKKNEQTVNVANFDSSLQTVAPQKLSFPPKYENSNKYSSTYTPSLSRLSPPPGDIDVKSQTKTKTTQIEYRHPTLGPDPINKEGTLEQPGTILIELPGKPILEVTSLRISDREPLSTVLLKQYEPVFNPLTGEIPQDIADEMDHKLYVGAELKEVYGELQQMISTQHSDIESYPDILSAPSASELSLAEGYKSNSTLHLPKKNRIVNSDLVRAVSHPWGEEGRESWLHANSYQGHKEMRRNSQRLSDSKDDGGKRMYNSWRRWWESHFTADDYLMWSSQRDVDFIGAIFHVYESEESADEGEDSVREIESPLEGKREMKKFIPGYWNVTEGAESDGIEPIEITHRKTYTSQNNEAIQEKLFEIWSMLETPGISQSEMAIKYGTQTSVSRAITALDLWLEVANEILKRESVLRELEIFEHTASDPLRFFAGPATAQLDECKQREKLHKRLKISANKIKPFLQRLRNEFGDTVTYKGVDYSYKMSRDTVQMLYWLEQERSTIRGNRVQYLWRGHEMPPSLPPLITSKLK